MRYWIGLGANLGDRARALRMAAARIGQLGRIASKSRIFETAAIGPPQPDYLNAAVALDSALEPLELLDRLQAIEAELGRVRTVKWGARTIDLDILMMGDRGERRVFLPRLTVPHPRLCEREFAKTPLIDLGVTLWGPNSWK